MQDELEKEGEVEAMCWREERFPPFGDAKKVCNYTEGKLRRASKKLSDKNN
jgi:hypothetical protein